MRRRHMAWLVGCVGAAVAGCGAMAQSEPARAQNPSPDGGLPLVPPARVDYAAGEAARPASIEARRTARDFGTFNTTWWTFGTGVSTDFDELSDINASVAWSKFVDDQVEMMVEVALREFDMPGDDQFGINPMLVFKRHWRLDDDNDWTAFAEIGIGLMLSPDDIPQNGTSFNFTPRFGGGLTYAVSDDWRLVGTLRWSHISNGRIFGNDDNPSSDGVMFSVGLVTSF